jgi:hypothetical protein
VFLLAALALPLLITEPRDSVRIWDRKRPYEQAPSGSTHERYLGRRRLPAERSQQKRKKSETQTALWLARHDMAGTGKKDS